MATHVLPCPDLCNHVSLRVANALLVLWPYSYAGWLHVVLVLKSLRRQWSLYVPPSLALRQPPLFLYVKAPGASGDFMYRQV
jgi:hypothetical protein